MLHTIYKITNVLNGKIYIGKHSTPDINDNYMGSGKYIKEAIMKYGIQNFIKEILFIFNDENEAYDMEKQIVNESFIKRSDVYNAIVGGDSFESINSNIELRKEKNKKAAISMNKINWNNPEFRERNRERMSMQSKKLRELGLLKTPNWSGKKHKEESKRKIGDKNSENQKGEKNSQYGTCWICHVELGNKKINKKDLNEYLSNGWIKGRVIKKSETMGIDLDLM
jgi:hypothetical protein